MYGLLRLGVWNIANFKGTSGLDRLPHSDFLGFMKSGLVIRKINPHYGPTRLWYMKRIKIPLSKDMLCEKEKKERNLLRFPTKYVPRTV